jgi:16S rRNA (adenine1518-N6/adenine1519-N6)-dimethyltransferase
MLDSLVRSAGVVQGDTILEIGPGTGTLTERMLAAGARVQAIELDHRLAGYLRDERFKDDKAFSLLEADACRTDLDSLMGEAPFRCVANLPYSCSSQLLASLTSMTNQPQDIHVLLQKEMADRLTAKAGTKEYGVLTVRLGLLYEISTVKTIPKNVFFPPPEVVSAFVRMRLRPKRPPRDVMASVSHVAGLAFGQRRKKTCRMLEPEYGAERVAAAFAAASLTEDVRADAITPQAYVRLGMELMKQ